MSPHAQLATEVASAVLAGIPAFRIDPGDPRRVQMHNALGEEVSVALEPVRTEIKPPTARHYFAGAETPAELFGAYREASRALPFEMDLPEARGRVHPYATEFLRGLFDDARTGLEDYDAARIARWVQDFDIYVAVKAVESLLNSKADLALLQIAEARGWCVHFDHLAIRCGSEATGDAERVARLLAGEHGYVASQVPGEKFYRFATAGAPICSTRCSTTGRCCDSSSTSPMPAIPPRSSSTGTTSTVTRHITLRSGPRGHRFRM